VNAIYSLQYSGSDFKSMKIKQDISIGNTIRSLRQNSGLTQEQVIAYLQLNGSELSRSSYSQIECGTYNIRISELKLLKDIGLN